MVETFQSNTKKVGPIHTGGVEVQGSSGHGNRHQHPGSWDGAGDLLTEFCKATAPSRQPEEGPGVLSHPLKLLLGVEL